MGNSDNRYTLERITEIDQGYFIIEASKNAYKAGRGSKTKSNIMLIYKCCS
jgi:hypothetical protein